jgi:hypothetical protein
LGLSLSRPAGITSFAGRPHSRTAPSRTEELEGSSERNASLCIVHWDAAIEFNCFLLVLVCVHACLGIHFLFHTTQRQHAGGAAGYGGSSPLIPLFRFSPRPPPSSWLPCSFHIHMRLVALLSLSLSQQSSDGMQKVEGTTYASLRVMECIQEFRSTNGLTAASSFLNLEVFAQFLFNSKETEELVYLTKKAHVLPHKPNPNPAPCIPRANKTPPIACMVWRSNAPKGHRPFQICCRFSSIMSVC